MNPANSEETVFAAAPRLPPDEREAYLDQSTHGDAALRRRVEALLKACGAGEFLEEAALPERQSAPRLSVPPTEKAGDRIGRYQLLQ